MHILREKNYIMRWKLSQEIDTSDSSHLLPYTLEHHFMFVIMVNFVKYLLVYLIPPHSLIGFKSIHGHDEEQNMIIDYYCLSTIWRKEGYYNTKKVWIHIWIRLSQRRTSDIFEQYDFHFVMLKNRLKKEADLQYFLYVLHEVLRVCIYQ